MLKKIISATLALVIFSVTCAYASGAKTYSYADNANILKNAYNNIGSNDNHYDKNKVVASAKTLNGSVYVQAIKGMQQPIPALMYHKVTDNPAEVTDYVVTGKMLEDDFAEIKARGYTPITVTDYYRMVKLHELMMKGGSANEIAEFFKNNPKPIIITFDDGYKGIYTHVLPLMKKYNFKVNFYICGKLIDDNHPEYCTWDEIKILNQSGLADIGNHTYSLHEKSKEELRNLYSTNFDMAIKDINKNRDVIAKNTGVVTSSFSFPYGQYNDITLNMMKAYGYTAFISTDYRVNRVSDTKLALGRFNRSAFETTKQFFDVVEQKCK